MPPPSSTLARHATGAWVAAPLYRAAPAHLLNLETSWRDAGYIHQLTDQCSLTSAWMCCQDLSAYRSSKLHTEQTEHRWQAEWFQLTHVIPGDIRCCNSQYRANELRLNRLMLVGLWGSRELLPPSRFALKSWSLIWYSRSDANTTKKKTTTTLIRINRIN
jgi:hypothetical protein